MWIYCIYNTRNVVALLLCYCFIIGRIFIYITLILFTNEINNQNNPKDSKIWFILISNILYFKN